MTELVSAIASGSVDDGGDPSVCQGDGTTCTECGKVFSHPFYFSTHISIHASEKMFQVVGQCALCGMVFSNTDVFSAHLSSSQSKMETQMMPSEEFSSFDPDNVSSLTAACVQFEQSGPVHKTPTPIKKRKSNKSMAIKIPPISASNDAVMGTPVTPSNDMGESRYKRKRKAPEKYMPDSRPQFAPRTPTSDVDPAVEAYLNSLSAMGLTVDPMAFGNSSAKRGRKTGRKVKGSNRRSSFGLDLDPSELFGIDVPQPKKPSPKYEYIDADALLEEDVEIIPKSGKNTRAQRLQQRLERLSQSGEQKRKVIDGEWEWYDKVAAKSETADKHVHHKMSSPRGGHSSKTKTASSPHSGNIHKIAKASTASHQYSLLITSPKMNKSPGSALSEPGNEKLRVSLPASRKSGTDLKFLGSTAVQKTPSLPGSIHNQTKKRNLLDMHQNVSHQQVQPSSRFQVYKRQGQSRPSVNCPPYEKNRTPRSPFTSHTRPLGHNTSNNPQGSVGVDSSKQTSRDYVEHMLQSVGVIAASSLPDQKRFSEDKGKNQRSNMGRNVQSHSRARGLWSDKAVNLPQGVNPFDTYFYKGRLKYWSKPFDSPGEDCSTPKEGYYREMNPFAQRGGQHNSQVSSTSQANAVARNGPIIEKGSVRGSYHAVVPNRGRGGVTLPRRQPPPKPFLKTDEVIVIDDDDEDIGDVISIEKDLSSKHVEVEAQASTSEILDEEETGVRIMDVDKEQEQSKNIQSIMDKKKQLSPCVVLQRNMSQERLVAHRTRCEEDNESDANGNESEENTSKNDEKNEKSDDNKNESIEDGTENDENETGDDDDMKEHEDIVQGEEIDGWKVCLAENSDSESEEGNPAELCQNTASDGGSFSTSSHNPDSDCSVNKNARIPDSSTKPQTHPSNHDLKDSEEDQSHSLMKDETLFSTSKEIDHTASTKRPKEEQSLPCDSQQNDQSRPKSTKIEDKDQSHGKNSPEMDGQSPSFGCQLQTWSPLNYSPVLDPPPSYSQDEVPSAKKMSKSKSSNDDSSGLGMLKQLKENDKSLPSQSDSKHRKPEKKMCADAKFESEVSCSLSHSDDKTDDLEKPSSPQTSFSKASNDYMSEGSNLLDIFSEIEKTCKEMEENSGNEWEESENTMDAKDKNGESENLLSEVLNKIGAVDEVNQGQRKGTSNKGQEKEGKEGEEQMNSRNKEDNSEIAAKNGEGKEIVDQENKEQLNLSDESDISGMVGKENRNREKVGVDQEDQENVGNDNEGQRKAENDNEVQEIHVVESDNEYQEKVERDSEDQEKVAENVGDDQEMMEVESESENIDSILKKKIKVNENIDEREANDKKSGGDDKSGENDSGIVSVKEILDETKERNEEMDDIINTKVDCMTEMERDEIEEVDGNDFAIMIEGKNEKTADEIDMNNEIGCTNKMEEVVNKEKECSEEINEAEKILTAEGMVNDNEKEEADEVERIEGGMMDKIEVRKTKGEVEGEMEIDMKERDEEDEVKTELENIDKNMVSVSDVTSDVKKGDENENGDGRMYEREEEQQVQEGNKSDPKLKLGNDDDDDDDKTRETDEANGMKREKESTRRKEIDNEVMEDKDVCGRGVRDKDTEEGCGSLSTHRGEAHSNNADHKHSVSDGAGKMENSSGTNLLSSSEKEEGKEQRENIDGTLESELKFVEIATNVGSCIRDIANNSSEEDGHGVLASNFRTAHKAVKNIDETKNLTKESTLNYDVEFKATENMDVTQNLTRESDSKHNVDSCISEDKCNIDNEDGSASQKHKSRSSCKDEENEDVGDHNDGGDDDDDNHCDGSNGTAGRGVQTTSNRCMHKGASGNGKTDSTTSNSGGNSGSSQNSILTMVLTILCQRTPSPLYLCHPCTCNTFDVSINMNYCTPLCDQNTCPSL